MDFYREVPPSYSWQKWMKANKSKVSNLKYFCSKKSTWTKRPPSPLGAIRAPVAHPTATVSMNTALAAATVVGDRCSRQHVTHRSNQQVRAEEVFSYPRIPQNPHTLPTATTFEFSWEKSMWENFSWRDDRNKSSSRRTAGGTEREADMMLTLSLNHEKKCCFQRSV